MEAVTNNPVAAGHAAVRAEQVEKLARWNFDEFGRDSDETEWGRLPTFRREYWITDATSALDAVLGPVVDAPPHESVVEGEAAYAAGYLSERERLAHLTGDETDPYFVLPFAREAIEDAIALEDGLDAGAGERVMEMIDAALAAKPTVDAPSSEPIPTTGILPCRFCGVVPYGSSCVECAPPSEPHAQDDATVRYMFARRCVEAGVQLRADTPPSVQRDEFREMVASVAFRLRHEGDVRAPCVKCGQLVERQREIYVHPTCYACLPPPEPLPVIPWPPSRPPRRPRRFGEGDHMSLRDKVTAGLIHDAKVEERHHATPAAPPAGAPETLCVRCGHLRIDHDAKRTHVCLLKCECPAFVEVAPTPERTASPPETPPVFDAEALRLAQTERERDEWKRTYTTAYASNESLTEQLATVTAERDEVIAQQASTVGALQELALWPGIPGVPFGHRQDEDGVVSEWILRPEQVKGIFEAIRAQVEQMLPYGKRAAGGYMREARLTAQLTAEQAAHAEMRNAVAQLDTMYTGAMRRMEQAEDALRETRRTMRPPLSDGDRKAIGVVLSALEKWPFDGAWAITGAAALRAVLSPPEPLTGDTK